MKDRNRLYWDQFKQMPSPCPAAEEQAAIVRFLDHADRRIRRYIRAKQKLIKLLEEQKQAIIHRAVTRGLDPNVRLKPSGVEWLGDVPEHWEVQRVQITVRASSGQTIRGATRANVTTGPLSRRSRRRSAPEESSTEYVTNGESLLSVAVTWSVEAWSVVWQFVRTWQCRNRRSRTCLLPVPTW